MKLRTGQSGQAIVGLFAVVVVAGAIALVVVLGGYWRTQVTFSPVLTGKVAGGTPFKETLTARHWLGGLVKGKQPDVDMALRKHLASGGRIESITIVTRHSLVDMLVTGITILIYTPVTIDISGTLVKEAPAAPTPSP